MITVNDCDAIAERSDGNNKLKLLREYAYCVSEILLYKTGGPGLGKFWYKGPDARHKTDMFLGCLVCTHAKFIFEFTCIVLA